MTTARSVMARKSVVVKLTPRQAFAVYRVLKHAAWGSGHEVDASRLFSARSAVSSALYEDGWERHDDGTWTKEVPGG